MKDMKIALDEAEKLQLPVPGLSLAKELYEELIKDGKRIAEHKCYIKNT